MVAKANLAIEFNSDDWSAMELLMDKYGDVDYPFTGKNENDELVTIYIWQDKIKTVTIQHNGWYRINTYHREDHTVEELYEK